MPFVICHQCNLCWFAVLGQVPSLDFVGIYTQPCHDRNCFWRNTVKTKQWTLFETGWKLVSGLSKMLRQWIRSVAWLVQGHFKYWVAKSRFGQQFWPGKNAHEGGGAQGQTLIVDKWLKQGNLFALIWNISKGFPQSVWQTNATVVVFGFVNQRRHLTAPVMWGIWDFEQTGSVARNNIMLSWWW